MERQVRSKLESEFDKKLSDFKESLNRQEDEER